MLAMLAMLAGVIDFDIAEVLDSRLNNEFVKNIDLDELSFSV